MACRRAFVVLGLLAYPHDTNGGGGLPSAATEAETAGVVEPEALEELEGFEGGNEGSVGEVKPENEIDIGVDEGLVLASGKSNLRSACTPSYSSNCWSDSRCCDSGKTCYEKATNIAVCLDSCTPGIHFNDPPAWRTPWTCRIHTGESAPAPPPPPPPPAPRPEPTSSPSTGGGGGGSCTASYSHNCWDNSVCCDSGKTCYEKQNHVAVCLDSCTPGIHWSDPPQWRTPWSCRVHSAPAPWTPAPSPPPPPPPADDRRRRWTPTTTLAPPTPAPVPAPTPATPAPPAAGGTCVRNYFDNCLHNPVCCDPNSRCYAKDNAVAICTQHCSPGIHESDPPQWRTPWTCRLVGPQTPAPPSWVPAPAPWQPAPVPAPTTTPASPSPTTPFPSTTPTPPPPATTTTAPTTTAPIPAKLLAPSNGEVMTFYMYRAQNAQNFPLSNINAANLAGTMWYLQNEVVSGVYGPGMKFGITRIIRFKVTMKATQPLLDKNMNFGVRVAFDSAQCTGPACAYDWQTYGYNVGCNKLGDWPFPQYDTHYNDGIWYSLPGKCPSKTYMSIDSSCGDDEPGGICSGTPTGRYDCTWNYELAGEIALDDLYEGTDLASFWKDADDDKANEAKVAKARSLFEAKYGEDPPVPPCDFKRTAF